MSTTSQCDGENGYFACPVHRVRSRGDAAQAPCGACLQIGHAAVDCPSRSAVTTPKPRTTVKKFAADLKGRIERAAAAFSHPGQEQMVGALRYVLGIVDAALSDYDVRDAEDVCTRRHVRPGHHPPCKAMLDSEAVCTCGQ